MAKTKNDGSDSGAAMEQTIQKEFRFKLSAEEKNQMADSAAKLTDERDALAEEIKQFNKAKRAELNDKQKEIDRLLKCHVTGTELREVTVQERLDWEKKQVQYFHNGKLLEEREMHDSELQMKLNTNPTAKKVKKDNRTRAQKNPDKHLTPEELKSQEIAEVHSMETKRKSKRSAVDPGSSEVHAPA